MAYGAAWYFDPRRWATVDGYVPFAVLWDAWRTLQSVDAARRLSLTRAIALGQPLRDDQVPQRMRAIEAEQQQAYPPERNGNGHA